MFKEVLYAEKKIDSYIYHRSIGPECWLMSKKGDKNEFKFVKIRLE